jgi:hypothetical protein
LSRRILSQDNHSNRSAAAGDLIAKPLVGAAALRGVTPTEAGGEVAADCAVGHFRQCDCAVVA